MFKLLVVLEEIDRKLMLKQIVVWRKLMLKLVVVLEEIDA
jgi:hypothetical protein